MDIQSTAFALLLIGVVYFFWKTVLPNLPRMSHARILALAVAALYLFGYFVVVISAQRGLVKLSSEFGVAPMLIWILPSSGASSVVIVEMIRTAIRSGPTWGDKLHFSVVGVSWLVLFAVQSFFVLAAARQLG